jgi:hypothetical protein
MKTVFALIRFQLSKMWWPLWVSVFVYYFSLVFGRFSFEGVWFFMISGFVTMLYWGVTLEEIKRDWPHFSSLGHSEFLLTRPVNRRMLYAINSAIPFIFLIGPLVIFVLIALVFPNERFLFPRSFASRHGIQNGAVLFALWEISMILVIYNIWQLSFLNVVVRAFVIVPPFVLFFFFADSLSDIFLFFGSGFPGVFLGVLGMTICIYGVCLEAFVRKEMVS